MVQRVDVPAPEVSRDAGNRAARTFAQGLVLDVAVAVTVALVAAVSDIVWTQAYWLAVAGFVGKSAVTAGISYLARKLLPPAL